MRRKDTISVYPSIATKIFEQAVALLPKVRTLDFTWNQKEDNLLLIMALNIAMVGGYQLAGEKTPLSPLPKLALDCNGWIWGHDNDCSTHHFRGITMETANRELTAWFSAENYSVLESCQLYNHYNFSERAEAMCDAILGKAANKENSTLPELIEGGFVSCTDGTLSANFPVFKSSVFEELCILLQPISETVADCMIEISARTEKLLSEYVPASVKNQCSDIAKIHHRLAVAAILLETLIEEKKLVIPDMQIPLCVWGVKCR